MTFLKEKIPTHIIPLMMLGQYMPIRTVLEFGVGTVSTRLFLDRRAFPDLTCLRSYEDDALWGETVMSFLKFDQRWSLDVIKEYCKIEENMSEYDVILIDSGEATTMRWEVIKYVLKNITDHSIVAIHDFQDSSHRQGVSEGFFLTEWNWLIPSTAFVSRKENGLANYINSKVHVKEKLIQEEWQYFGIIHPQPWDYSLLDTWIECISSK